MNGYLCTALGIFLGLFTQDPILTIRPGESIHGAVKENDPIVTVGDLTTRFRDPLHGIPVLFTPTGRGRFTIAAESLDCETFLCVCNGAGELLADNDDGPVWTDSRLFLDADAGEQYTIRIRKKVLGCDHPDTVATMRILARYLSGKGYREEASELFEEALEQTR
jgi:hypothetical protein